MSEVVRPANAEEVTLLAALERAAFPHDPWSEVSLQKALSEKGYVVLVVECGGEVGGYLLGWNVLDEADLARLAVWPTMRRRGLGRSLVAAAIVHWRGAGVERVFLDVRAGNESALGLYASLGFTRDGLRRSYYPDGEDAVLMSLTLPPAVPG